MGSGRKGNLMDRGCIPHKMVSISVSSKWVQEAAEAYNHRPEAYSRAIFKTDWDKVQDSTTNPRYNTTKASTNSVLNTATADGSR